MSSGAGLGSSTLAVDELAAAAGVFVTRLFTIVAALIANGVENPLTLVKLAEDLLAGVGI